MSDPLKKNKNQHNEQDIPPTKIFDDSVLIPGSQIGRFRIEQELGRGAVGVVYLAHDTKLDRMVAIKSIPAEVMDNPKVRSRFAREARVLASLNHSNIAAIYEELEQGEGRGYLVLEYVPGQTLAEKIAEKGLEFNDMLSIAMQIAEAMAAAHEQDVIHRDLKPGNIKITPEGKVKVLDFGLAKAVGDEVLDEHTTVTEPGRMFGTPAYMSPEQARGKFTDKCSDIWSFGCVMYEMLTGATPFKGETVSDTLANILQSEPDWQILPKDTPENIRILLRRCLEKDPKRRLRDIGYAGVEISESLSTQVAAPLMGVRAKSRNATKIIGVATIVLISVIAMLSIRQHQTLSSSKEIRLVVLPFENLGLTEDDYFTDGVTEEITSRLSAIHSLGVISRTSATQYRKSDKTIRQIGEELEVDYVLEGTVRWVRPSEGPSQVRVTPQLIRVSDDTHLWSDRYDAVLSNIFQVQTDIAEKVAKALNIALLEPELQVIESKPTQNMEAYEYYLRGNEYFYRSTLGEDMEMASQFFEKAVAIDPNYTLAYARLSEYHSNMYWHYYDHTDQRRSLAKQAIDKAFELNPDLPEVRLALGRYYYHCHLDYDRALEQFDIARISQPSNGDLLSFIGYVQRRQGKFEQALVHIKKAAELDPLSPEIAFELADTFMLARNYPEAENYYKRSSLSPDLPWPYANAGWLYLRWDGDIQKARETNEQVSWKSGYMEHPYDLYKSVIIEVLDRKYQQALDTLSSIKLETFDTQFIYIPKELLFAQINGLMGNKQSEQEYYESTRNILEAKVKELPEDSRFHSYLGIVYAGLGLKDDAMREGELATELLPVSKEAWRGTFRAENLALIYMMVGEYDKAIEKLEFLLGIPSELTVPLLRLDPAWDPLRDHPRFKKLVE
ncbi:MAG: protein kinase domain-containing protein [Planctomycetota bacterium]|jgi:serine/threonine protein kinase/Tfp pilus assembly protein PilF